MRKALPVITEAVETLKQRLQHERDGRKKPRLQMLYLLGYVWNTCNIGHSSTLDDGGRTRFTTCPTTDRLTGPASAS